MGVRVMRPSGMVETVGPIQWASPSLMAGGSTPVEGVSHQTPGAHNS